MEHKTKICITALLLMWLAAGMQAQKLTRIFRNTSLSEALIAIDKASNRYTINFIYDELEDFMVTADIKSQSVPDAVRQMVGFYPMRVTVGDSIICVECVHKEKTKLTGRLIDENGSPVEFANISLLSVVDSALITGGVSNADGWFVIPCGEESVIAKVTFVGYKTVCHRAAVGDIGTIRMQPDATVLGSVVVKGTRPVFRREIDRMIFDVENSPVAQGSSVMDLLRHTPLVKVTDNSIGIIGKNSVKVMLNGKLSYLDSSDLVQYLKSLQSDNVASIEVITTPPSKYDAGGNGGMINIVTKRSLYEGWNGSAGMSYRQRTYAGGNANAAVNYRSSKVLFSVKIRQSRDKGAVDEAYRIQQADGEQSSVTVRKDTYRNIGGNLFMEYQPSGKSILGAVYDFSYGKDNIDIVNSYLYGSSNGVDSVLYTKSLQKGSTIVHTVNMYYDLQLDTLGKKLGLAFNYMHHAPDKNVNFTTVNQTTGDTYVVREPNDISYAIYTGEANLELPFPWLKIETGVKYSDIMNKSDMQYYNMIGDDFVAHPGRCNRFNYEEHTLAGYVSARKDLNSCFSMQAGLRYEHTYVKGVTPHSDTEDVRNDYGKLFPTVYLTFKPGSAHNFHLNYARRINRPYFRAVNPFKWYSNPNNVDEGNPALRPSYADNIEFGYMFRNLSVVAYYQKEDDAYGQILSVADDKTTYSTYQNIYDNRQLGISLNYSLNVADWWNVYVAGNYVYNKSDIKAEGYVAQNGHSFDYKVNNTISFDKARRFQLFVTYMQNLPYRVGVTYDRSYANFSMGLKCAFLDNNLVLNVYGNDLFKQDLVKREKVSASDRQTYNNYYDSRYFRISLVYKWGNRKMKVQKKNIPFSERNRI